MSFEIKSNGDIEAMAGDTGAIEITITENDIALDITNHVLLFTVKLARQITDENAIIRKTVTNHTDPVNGKTEISITSNDTDKPENEYIMNCGHCL